MLFTSGSFVLLVLVTFVLFYVPPLRRFQTGILILSSFVFYATNSYWLGETGDMVRGVGLVSLLIASIVLNAWCSRAALTAGNIRAARVWLAVGVIINLLILGFFKYSGLLSKALPSRLTGEGGMGHFLLNITLPVGISFFTFEGISLLVDSFHARGVEKFLGDDSGRWRNHLSRTTLFVSFFPHLVAGPILKAHDFYPQIKTKRLADIDWEFCFRRIVVGYFLKMVVADGLKESTAYISFPTFLNFPSIDLVALLFGFSMQIFADFAGYSLIAIGIAGLFGYRLPENFNFPYISQSFSEFWRRWHISLSTWLRDYLYFPLGGNRRGLVRTYFNLIVVMLLGGLWHGAAISFALWGLVHGVALAIERAIVGSARRQTAMSLPWQILRVLLVFTVVTLAWLVFKLPYYGHAILYLKTIFRNTYSPPSLANVINILVISSPVIVYHAAYLLRESRLASRFAWARPVALGTMIFLIAVNSAPSGTFIYFQF